MNSEKQLLANQQNAQLSTGPKTSKGKAIIATNAIKHGIFNLTERLAERNRKALSGETDLNEIRAGTFPFLQYAELIRPKLPTDSQSDVIDRVSKKAAIKAFEKNFDDGVEVLTRTPNGLDRLKQMDQEESLALRRIRKQEIFLTAFGFTEADPLEKTLEYVSREKYDQLINTSDASLGSSPKYS